MAKKKYSLYKAEMVIKEAIKNILKTFTDGKCAKENAIKYTAVCNELDEQNPDYKEIREDYRERNKMSWRFAVLCFTMIIDFFLLFHGISLLCETLNLPEALKLIVPISLICLEVAISYFSRPAKGILGNWQQRTGISKYLPYFVIIILIGMSLMVIFFSFMHYSQSVDGMSLADFLLGTVAIQITLLVASIMLHIWLIHNAEEIVEMFGYRKYYAAYTKKTNASNKEDRKAKRKYKTFITQTSEIATMIQEFKDRFPGASTSFSAIMPVDLINAMNLVMGRIIIAPPNNESDDKSENPNTS